MLDPGSNRELPPIPAKRYFTIGEVSELCDVKPHVLRYWETEFPTLSPVKRRGNRRYYQHHEVLLIRRIRELLYEEGFTISGARNRLDNAATGDERHELRGARLAAAGTAPAAAGAAGRAARISCRSSPVAALSRRLRAPLMVKPSSYSNSRMRRMSRTWWCW